jgi:hypothetical protein
MSDKIMILNKMQINKIILITHSNKKITFNKMKLDSLIHKLIIIKMPLILKMIILITLIQIKIEEEEYLVSNKPKIRTLKNLRKKKVI